MITPQKPYVVGAVFASLLTAGCASQLDSLIARPASRPMASIHAVGADTVFLQYVCGNTYRVYHNGGLPADTSLQWSSTKPQLGSVQMPKLLSGMRYAEAFFETDFADSVAITGLAALKEANSGTSACIPSRDTTWPIAADLAAVAQLVDSSVKLAGPTASDSVWGRTARIRVNDTVSRQQLAQLLAPFKSRVAGFILSGSAMVRIDEVRPTYSGYSAMLDSLRQAPGVEWVLPALISDPTRPTTAGRMPVDASPFTLANWKSKASALWPYLNSRLDLAWSCENGAYGVDPASIAFIEAMPLQSHSDINGSRVGGYHVSVSTPGGLAQLGGADVNYFQEHALAVAGIPLALTNNANGISGIVWQGRGVVLGRSVQSGGNWYGGNDMVLQFLHAHLQSLTPAPKILNLSSFNSIIPTASSSVKQAYLQNYTLMYRSLLDNLPALSIVVAAGNDSVSSISALMSLPGLYPVELLALLDLRSQPTYASRIVVVSAENASHAKPSFANDFPGVVDIFAPGAAVPVLRYPGSSGGATDAGTSFAAPFVAGVMSLMYTLDENMSPTDAKAALLAGATTRKGRNSSGGVISPTLVSGGSAYSVDAFAALSRTSARSSALPVCGAQVGWDLGGNHTILKYNVDSSEKVGPPIPIDAQLSLSGLSVAPGGRRIAMSGWDGNTWQFANWTAVLSGGSWSVSRTGTGSWKSYLYEDTASVVMSDYFSPIVNIQSDSSSRRVSNLDLTGKGADTSQVYDYWISPTGDWLVAEELIWDPSCYSTSNTRRVRFFALRSGMNSTTVDSIRTCTSTDALSPSYTNVLGGAAFTDAGDTVVTAGYNWYTNHSGVLRKYALGSSPSKIGSDAYGDTTVYWLSVFGLGNKIGFGEFRTIYNDWALTMSTPGCPYFLEDRSYFAFGAVAATVPMSSACVFGNGASFSSLSASGGAPSARTARASASFAPVRRTHRGVEVRRARPSSRR